jgi:hypothetical protein
MNFINDDITPILTRCSCGCIVLNMKHHLETNKHKILIEGCQKNPKILKQVKKTNSVDDTFKTKLRY